MDATIKAIYSNKRSADEAAADLRAQADTIAPKLVIYFASSMYDPIAIASSMKRSFPSPKLIGCTTAGEIVSGKMLTKSVVAMCIGTDIVEEVAVETLKEIKTRAGIEKALSALIGHFSPSEQSLDLKDYIGIILVDGLSGAEEYLMENLGDLSDLTFIGGSAGDDLKFKKTYVFHDASAQSNAAVLALLKLRRGFDVIKTQSFTTTGRKLVASEVDETARRVISFNHKPAADAYAEVLDVSVAKAADRFMSNPLGLMMGPDPYIRSPQRLDGKDMIFYCNVKSGMELEVMSATDIVGDTRKAVLEKQRQLGGIAGIIDFHCILRTLELRELKQTDSYGAIFADIPTIGFSTYGEEYIGHINQTSTMLVFK
jgi:hypothetical protein